MSISELLFTSCIAVLIGWYLVASWRLGQNVIKRKLALNILHEAETQADDALGEWAGVDYVYIPERLEPIYDLRESIREAIRSLE